MLKLFISAQNDAHVVISDGNNQGSPPIPPIKKLAIVKFTFYNYLICVTWEECNLRIISGSRRGQKLIEFDGMDIRPTTDRVRESIFNLIQEFIYQSSVLDLFSGSGALSFESLSRGAASAVCVDIDKRSVAVICENSKRLKFSENISIINNSAQNFIKSCNNKFNIIFLDPPYNKGFIKPIIDDIVRFDILEDEGIIVLESDSIDEHGEMDGLTILKQRKYGRTFVTIYQRGDTI